MTFQKLEQKIKADGWYEIKGGASSHQQYGHLTKKGKVTISYHGGDLPKITVNSVLK